MEKLKPCPFCGHKAHTKTVKNIIEFLPEKAITPPGKIVIIGCDNPDCILYMSVERRKARLMFMGDSREAAVKTWNRRAK